MYYIVVSKYIFIFNFLTIVFSLLLNKIIKSSYIFTLT